MEFDRRRLAKRFYVKYAAQDRALWLVRVYAPIEGHAAIAHALHRREGLELENGWVRFGPQSFGMLSRRRFPPHLTWHGRTLRLRVSPIRLNRKLRAWREFTGGMLVDRKTYGADFNRYYVRGLPPAAREKFEVVKLDRYQPYKRGSSPRAWRDDASVLIPPEIFALRRNERRAVRAIMAQAYSPEGVARVKALLAGIGTGSNLQSTCSKPTEGRLTKQQVMEWYQAMADRRVARESAPPASPSSSPPSLVGGYISSGHSGGAPPPPRLADEPEMAIGASGKRWWMENGSRPDSDTWHDAEPWRPSVIDALPEDALTRLNHRQYQKRRIRQDIDATAVRVAARMKERKGN
jgi:hypothetical protein